MIYIWKYMWMGACLPLITFLTFACAKSHYILLHYNPTCLFLLFKNSLFPKFPCHFYQINNQINNTLFWKKKKNPKTQFPFNSWYSFYLYRQIWILYNILFYNNKYEWDIRNSQYLFTLLIVYLFLIHISSLKVLVFIWLWEVQLWCLVNILTYNGFFMLINNESFNSGVSLWESWHSMCS